MSLMILKSFKGNEEKRYLAMQRSSWHHLDQTYYIAKEFSLNQKESNKKENFEIWERKDNMVGNYTTIMKAGLFLWVFVTQVKQMYYNSVWCVLEYMWKK